MILGEERILVVAAGLLKRRGKLLVVDIGDALKEEQRKDIGLEVGCIDRPAQDVCRLPQVRLQDREVEGRTKSL